MAATVLPACGTGVPPGGSGGGTGSGSTGTAGTDGTADETGVDTTDTDGGECIGSALCFDPPDCLTQVCGAPMGATDDCIGTDAAVLTVNPLVVTEELSATQEAEISAVVTPDGVEYVATIVMDWECRGTELGGVCDPPAPDAPTHCIVQKGVHLYRRLSGAASFERVEGGEDLWIDQGATSDLRWYTDPYLAVAPGGAVYMNILKWPGHPDRECSAGNLRPFPVADFDEEIQLWAIPPNEDTLRKVAVDEVDGFTSVISAGLNQSSAQALDHPRVAAFSHSGGLVDRVVVTFSVSNEPDDNQRGPDRFVTLRCDWDPGCTPEDADFAPGGQVELPDDVTSFSNPRFDPDGDLYIAHGHQPGPDDDDPIHHPHVHRYTWNGNAWDAVDEVGGVGGPLPMDRYFTHDEDQQFWINVTGPRAIVIDKTPAIAVGRLGEATTPVVWLAWVTNTEQDGTGEFGIEIAAANANDLTAWTPTVQVQKPDTGANNWAPELALDGQRNVLDVVMYNSNAGAALGLDAAIWPRVTRFRANDLAFVDQEDAVPSPGTDAPRVGELPTRSATTSEQLFIGEYIGLAMHPDDDQGLVAWNLQLDEVGGPPRPRSMRSARGRSGS